ncbi:phage tail protein [Photobacterium phosphoreum]|nr:phage tail protein [Photobacterium phosphoreum]
MSNTATVITTKAGEALIAKMQAENKVLVIDKFIFANVPNRPAFPDRDDVVPVEHVVHESAVHEQGRLTENSVIYSTTLASNVGPFSFNWSGLFCSEHNVLVAINFPPPVDKTVDAPGITGNTLVRSFVMEYKGIAETTNITVDPSSWQYDAHKRMSKMDNDTAQAIIDQNGKDWFIDDGFIVTPQSSAYSIKAGAGYVSGHRISLDFDRIIQVPEKPAFIYVDAFREGSPIGEWQTKFTFVVAADEKDDYTDAQGVNHFVCKIAQVFEDGSVGDMRIGSISNVLFSQITDKNVYPSNPLGNLIVNDVLNEDINAVRYDNKIWYIWGDVLAHKQKVISFVDNCDYGTATLTTPNGTYECIRSWVHAARVQKDAKGWGYVPDANIDSTAAIKRAIEDVNKFDSLYVCGGGKFGLIPIRKEIKIYSNNTPIYLNGDNAGFVLFGVIKKIEVLNFTIVGDGVNSSRHKLISLGANVEIGTFIVKYNNISNCIMGISAGFENGRKVNSAYILYNKISNIKGVNPGEGYGIHAANDRYNGSYGELYIAYNQIDNCERHSIYCARSNGFKVLFNTIKNHRANVTTGDLRVALNLARSTDVVAAYNEFDTCYDGCIAIGADEVDGNVYDATNVQVYNNNFINPKVLAPIYVGYLEYDKGKINNISIYGNTFNMADNALPLIEVKMGFGVSFSRNKAYYRAPSKTFNIFVFSAIGERGKEKENSDQWIVRDNEIYIRNRDADSKINIYRFNKRSNVSMYLLDNIVSGNTSVVSVAEIMTNSIIYMSGHYPELESGITPLDMANPSLDKQWHETSAQIDTPNGQIKPAYKGQEIFLTKTEKFWKAKGFNNTDWIPL